MPEYINVKANVKYNAHINYNSFTIRLRMQQFLANGRLQKVRF